MRSKTAADVPAQMLDLAVRGLAGERSEWGQAMRAELQQVHRRRQRWSFSLGCVRAAAGLRIQAAVVDPERGGTLARASIVALCGAALALAAYGLLRYPGLRSGASAWASVAYLVVLLLAYVACGLTLARGTAPPAVAARRYGSAGGLAMGASWVVVLEPSAETKSWVLVPLATALLVPAGTAVLAARSANDPRASTDAALWAGIVGGLLVFLVWVEATYLRDGRPYDPQLVRDFHASGAHDLTTYAVSDNLGAALGLLLIIPTVALALGSLAGRVAAGRQEPGAPEPGR